MYWNMQQHNLETLLLHTKAIGSDVGPTMITNGVGDYVKWRGEHDNPPDVDQAISVMVKCVREVPLTPFQQIYNFEAATLTYHGLDL